IKTVCLPSFLYKSIDDLNIGTYKSTFTIKYDCILKDALRLLVDQRISSLPIVDDNGKVVDVFSKFDIFNPETVYYIKKSNTLLAAIDKICLYGIHRLNVIDENEKLVGILSLSDILKFIVLKNHDDQSSFF
ncbi:hypothetical protein A3Q56_02840, partial [Intoshia linei]